MVTAYDALFARLAEDGGADAVLVGDSVGPAILALSEADITMQDMAHHGAAVRRGLRNAALILDIPSGVVRSSLGIALADVLQGAAAVGATAVKIEGVRPRERELIRAVSDTGVCVVGHLSPSDGDAAVLEEASHALAEVGACALVLQNVAPAVAARITRSVPIATISVGSGDGCHGALMNILELMGLLRARHAEVDVGSVPPAADAVVARISAFCAATRQGVRPRAG